MRATVRPGGAENPSGPKKTDRSLRRHAARSLQSPGTGVAVVIFENDCWELIFGTFLGCAGTRDAGIRRQSGMRALETPEDA